MASAPLPNPHDHSFQAAARRKEVYIGQSGLCHGRGVLAGRNLNRVQDAVVFTSRWLADWGARWPLHVLRWAV